MLYEGMDRRSLNKNQQEHLRQLAVEGIIAGKSKPEIAKELGVCLQAVHNWWNAYQKGLKNCEGQTEADLKSSLQIQRGRKSKIQALSTQQLEEIKNIISTYLPRRRSECFPPDDEKTLGLAKSLSRLVESANHFQWARWGIDCAWSINDVQKMVFIRYGVELSRGIISRMLKKWGFIPEDMRAYPTYARKLELIETKKDWLSQKRYKIQKVPYYITLFRNPKCDVSSIIAVTGKSHISFVGFKNSVLNQPTAYFHKKVRESLMQSLKLGLRKEKKDIRFEYSPTLIQFLEG